MSALAERALREAGLAAIAEGRRAGDLERVRGRAADLRSADLLPLGALADQIRADEVGDVVRVYTGAAPDGPDVVRVDPADGATGLDLLRAVAIARITGPRAARVRVDWTRAGLELAQVALGFGADELVGFLASKRGLPLAEDARLGVGKESNLRPAALVKRDELAGYIVRAGRRPVFVPATKEGSA